PPTADVVMMVSFTPSQSLSGATRPQICRAHVDSLPGELARVHRALLLQTPKRQAATGSDPRCPVIRLFDMPKIRARNVFDSDAAKGRQPYQSEFAITFPSRGQKRGSDSRFLVSK